MKLTIAVCTYRRFDWLKKCLDALKNQTLPSHEYKILVIDNSLTKEKSGNFRDSLQGFSNLQYIITDRCGIGYARTVAMEKCSTEFLAYTDDDCLVPSDWAENILRAFERHGEGAGVIGGRVIPDWEADRPGWLDDDLLAPLGMIDWGDEDIFIDQDSCQWLLSANAVYRTRVLRMVGGFPSHLGRKRALPLAHEEFAANHAINAIGYDLVYSPLLSVKHFVPAARADQKMLCRDAFWDGVSQVLFRNSGVEMDDVDRLSGLLLPLQEQFLTDFKEFASQDDLKQKISQMRGRGWQAAEDALGNRAGKDLKQPSVIYLVTPSLNASRTIDQTIASVTAQAGDFSIRYHIQDGGSTDGTIEKLEQWRQRLEDGSFPVSCRNIVFTYRSEPDQGMYDAISKGFATMFIPPASFMGWINADDLLFPFALDQVANIDRCFGKDVCWLGGKIALMDEKRKLWHMYERILPNDIIKEGLCDGLHWDFVQQEGSFFRGELWAMTQKEGVFDGFKLAGDWNLWRILAQKTRYYQLQWPLGIFRISEGQLSQREMDKYIAEINAVLSPEKRRESFMELTARKNLKAHIIRADLKSGKLVAADEDEKAVKGMADHYRRKFFGSAALSETETGIESPGRPQNRKIRHLFQIKPQIKNDGSNVQSSLKTQSQPAGLQSPHHPPQPPMRPDPAKILFGPGWHRLEGNDASWWRWTSQSGIVHLKTGRGGWSSIRFSTLSVHRDNTIILRLNGRIIETVPAGRDETDAGPIKVRLKRGTNIFEFASGGQPAVSQKDPRPLNFMIKNLDFIPPGGANVRPDLSGRLKILKKSGLFLTGYYKSRVPELAGSGVSPAEHYLLYGAWENKDPNPLFSSAFYLAENRDVYLSGKNPLLHYIGQGWSQGRDPHPEFCTKRYLKAYPDAAKSGLNPLLYYLKYGVLEGQNPCPSFRIDPRQFHNFTFSRRSHWKLFDGYDKELFGKIVDKDECTLKEYQDLLVFAFIKEHVPPGSRILDIGGGHSRILEYFANTHDCWNIDKLEGLGNGPKRIGDVPFNLVQDYMGNFNPKLPDGTFDFVFSISALEHTAEDRENFDSIIKDIDRVLKPGGYSLHLFDVLFKRNGKMWTNSFVHRIFSTVETINKFVEPESVNEDKDLYCMSESAYNKSWLHTTGRKYSEFGRPVSLNILWHKQL